MIPQEYASANNQYNSLLQLFDSVYPLSEELTRAIVENSDLIEVKKKTKLLMEGAISNSIYFIVKGAARVYYLNSLGTETTTWFLFENELLISVYSFFTGKSSFEYVETLEDCTLIVLKRDKLDSIYRNFMEFNFIGRKLTEYYYIRNEEQANSLRMCSAKERYLKIIDNQPHLLKRVPLGYIASYLGISQETLSRIRKQI